MLYEKEVNEKKEVLWISLRAPYDSVPHAGGKTHNFYVKQFHKSGIFKIHLISFCYRNELDKLDLDRYGISNDVSVIEKNEKIRGLLKRVGLPISLFEYKFIISEVKRKLRYLRETKYSPDIILLQWTEIVMLASQVKKSFPKAKIVAIEEDVTFLKTGRKYQSSSGLKKLILGFQNMLIRKKELRGLMDSDLVVLNNSKDQKLILESGGLQGKTFVTSPYFEDMSFIERKPENNLIIYWGAMNRPENVEAVLWFVNYVYPLVHNIHFTVIGSNPPDEILKLREKGITVTGFVESPREYFEKCTCMVVPLRMGAGIKIKVLEGMSAGIPVLTNNIGIEGIEACEQKHYLHCELPTDYVEALNKLCSDRTYGEQIGKNARGNIQQNYNIDEDIQRFIREIENI